MRKYILFVFIAFQSFVFGQKNIFDAQQNKLAYIKENVLLNKAHQVVYMLKGQIVFSSLSEKKEDILLTIELKKNKTLVFNQLETQATFIFEKNAVYYRQNRVDVLVAMIDKKAGFTSFYNAYTDSLIAYLDTENVSELELPLAFYYIWNELNLKSILAQQTLSNPSGEKMPEGVIGYMKPVYGDPLNVWIWDGKYLYPAYDRDPRYVWVFDGKTIKPDWNSRIETEWSWDGEELKPYWGGHPKNNWRWEGNIFRQIFDSNYRNEFEIVDGIARKRFGTYGEIEWEIHGDMPLALVSVVLLRIVYR